MPTITISLTGAASVNGTRTYTLNDAAVTDFITWARTVAFPPPINSSDARTDGQVLAQWADDFVSRTKAGVSRMKKEAVARAAANAEPGISIT